MAIDPFCQRGHLRSERPNGDFVCRICHNANRDRRELRSRASGKPPQDSVPTTVRCVRGHKKVRRASGDLACQWCEAARRRELRRLEREGTCPHVGSAGFEGLLNLNLRLICLKCVAAEMAA